MRYEEQSVKNTLKSKNILFYGICPPMFKFINATTNNVDLTELSQTISTMTAGSQIKLTWAINATEYLSSMTIWLLLRPTTFLDTP